MQKSVRLLTAAALIALGIAVWYYLFPSPERVIRSQLKGLAGAVSFQRGEGTIVKGYKAQKLLDYFFVDVEISVNMQGYPARTVSGRDELMQALLWAQSNLASLNVEFLDINITLGPDRQTATANLTCRVQLPNDRGDLNVQELNLRFRKLEDKWKIDRIETVKTLAHENHPPFPLFALNP